ncbi:MAG TPA: hypothetical protein VLG74_02860 [Blastocatellia bacterium]|nr:hypothetical protein [Blastocatellia bacterium]
MNCVACEEVTFEFRYCPEHHSYRFEGQRLTSVTRVISSIIPYEPKDPAAADNARDRGVETDDLFCAYVTGKLREIPANTRLDSIALFEKLRKWWDSERRGTPEVQGIVHDKSVAGKFDLRCDGIRYDLKCTYVVSPLAPIQLAAYESLDTQKSEELRIIHATERFKEVKIKYVPMADAMADWHTLRSAWELKKRLRIDEGD